MTPSNPRRLDSARCPDCGTSIPEEQKQAIAKAATAPKDDPLLTTGDEFYGRRVLTLTPCVGSEIPNSPGGVKNTDSGQKKFNWCLVAPIAAKRQ
jgi:hypothetical protein